MNFSSPDGRRCSIPCSANTNARAGWKATFSPAGMGSSTVTKPSSASLTPCSASTPSGLKSPNELPWRRKIASLNFLLASHVWQQDHNGFTHQDPGFLDHVINKKAEHRPLLSPSRMPIASYLFSITACAAGGYVNVVVAGKHPLPQWLTIEEAEPSSIAPKESASGNWASNDQHVRAGCRHGLLR